MNNAPPKGIRASQGRVEVNALYLSLWGAWWPSMGGGAAVALQ